MNAAGWTVMTISVGSVVTLVSFCLFKVLSLPPVEVEEHLRAPPDIDTACVSVTTIGSRIPIVPKLVPVANDRAAARRKTAVGSKFEVSPAEASCEASGSSPRGTNRFTRYCPV